MKNIILIILLFLSGCDFLTTRNAEEPDIGRSSFVVATTPEQLFKNLTDSFREKIEPNYVSCFVDSAFLKKKFMFYASSEATAKFGVLSDWNIDSEKDYFKNLITNFPEKTIIVNLFDENKLPLGDSAIYVFNYTILLPNISNQVDLEYRGSSEFKINLDANNQWVITEWTDIGIEEFPSWSVLKGNFY